jgi:DNA-directed RNA polymerase subunit M/transcription elongation factor TFIIS
MKKESLYWSDTRNVFRPNKNELNEKLFKCPKCKNILARIKNKNQEPVFFCANCKYEIPEQKLLHDRNKIQEFKEMKKQKIISYVVNEMFKKSS